LKAVCALICIFIVWQKSWCI